MVVLIQPRKTNNDQKIQVVTSNAIIKSMVESIGGENISVESLINNGDSIHEFNPNPEQIKKISDSSIYFQNGLGLESSVKVSAKNTVTLTDGFKNIDNNPHAYISFTGINFYLNLITSELSKISPKNKSYFQARRKSQEIKINELKNKYLAKDKNFTAVTNENTLAYLSNELGFKIIYIENIADSNNASVKSVSDVINNIKNGTNYKLFKEPNPNDNDADKIIETISSDSNKAIDGTIYSDSLSENKNFLSTFEDNLKTLYKE